MSSWFAIASMQLAAFRNSMRRGAKRDPLPTAASSLFAGITALLSVAMGMGTLVVFALGNALDVGVAFWILCALSLSSTMFAVLSAVSGEASSVADARSLQLYPLTRPDLLRLDLISQMLAPSLLMFAPAMLGASIGIAYADVTQGRIAIAPFAAAAPLVLFVANVTLVRIVASFVAAGGRRLREWIALFFVSGFVSFAYLGPELDRVPEHGSMLAEKIGSAVLRATWVGAAADLGVYQGARASLSPAMLSQGIPGLVLDAAILAAWLGALLAVHRRVTRRLLDGEGGYHARVRRGPAAAAAGPSLLERLLPAPVFGVAVADLRSMLRIPMMWILLLMPGMFGIFLARRGTSGQDAEAVAQIAIWMLPAAALGAHVLFSSQIFSNVFGIDRDATAHFLLAPVSSRSLLAGKMIARFAFGSIQVLVFLSALTFRLPGLDRHDLFHAYCAWFASAFWVSSLGMILSIRMPVRMTFGQQKEQRFERAAVSMVGQLFVLVALVPAAAMILGGRALGGEHGYITGIAVTAVSGAILWVATSVVADEMLATRGTEMVDALSSKG